MIPVGRAIRLWRFVKGKTQNQLARQSGIPRPNLSMIEQGARDVTVSTLRRLAAGLAIRPGVLADGLPPPAYARRHWSREALDRMARRLAGLPGALGADEKQAVELLCPLVSKKIRRGTALGKHNWLASEVMFGPSQMKNLLGRIEKFRQVKP